MPQASCCQARRLVKRDAQQSPDCEHPSKHDNTAWQHEAPLHRSVGRRAGFSGTRAVSFGSFSFPVKENEQTEKKDPRIDQTSPGPPPEMTGLDQD